MTKGAGVILFGTIIGMALGFIARILIIRSITQAQYGVYSLGIAVISTFALISTLGLQRGLPRQIPYYEEKEPSKTGKAINSSLIIALVSSIVISVFLFFTSNVISIELFQEPGLTNPLRIFSITLPFVVLLRIFTSIFRGYGKTDVRVYFSNISRNLVFLIGVGFIFILGLSFIHLILSYFVSFALTCLFLIIYVKRRSTIDLKLETDFDFSVGKDMLIFSLPLFSSAAMVLIMSQMDTLVMGFFLPSEKVGLYRGAYPLARLIPLILSSSTFIYLPVFTKLHAKSKKTEIVGIYRISTRWIYSLTFPVFLIIFLFPETVIGFLFGAEYEAAALILRILSVGFMGRVVVGMNGMTLTGGGKPKINMYGNLVGGTSNMVLNFTLIPFLGVLGAAISTSFSYMAQNAYQSLKLNSIFDIHPFDQTYLKTILISSIVMVLVFSLSKLVSVNIFSILLFFCLYLMGFFASIYFLGIYEKEDVDFLRKLKRKVRSFTT